MESSLFRNPATAYLWQVVQAWRAVRVYFSCYTRYKNDEEELTLQTVEELNTKEHGASSVWTRHLSPGRRYLTQNVTLNGTLSNLSRGGGGD